MNRTPPAEVRRRLRSEVGYGCPIAGCRKPFMTWHHFDPPWHKREHHDEKGMIALCREHHDEADAGAYSTEQLRALKESSASADTVMASFDCWAKQNVLVRLGGLYCGGSAVIFALNNKPIIKLVKDDSGLLRLSFELYREDGVLVLSMDENVFECEPQSIHDLETSTGKTSLKMWHGQRDIGLELSFRRITQNELHSTLAADKSRSDKQTAIAIKTLPPEMQEALRTCDGKGSFDHFPEPCRSAYNSGDHVGWHIREWAKINCMDDEGKITLFDFKNMKLHESGRAIIIRNGIQEGKRQIGYGGAFDNMCGAVNL